MIDSQAYLPVFELLRGSTVESIHHGAIAVVDVHGRLIASFGQPETVTFLRSSAKPFQLLPFIEHGGQSFFGLTERELAVMCASHSGTDEHAAVVSGIQAKAGLLETDLMCGVHTPMDEPTAETLRERKELPTPNRHNCSGKHTGMLAYAQMSGRRMPDVPYIYPQHPVQLEIRQTFADMCLLTAEQVAMGTDGCSAPNFAIPLERAAHAFARLCAPKEAGIPSPERAVACTTICTAMMHHPDMVAGPGKFDTCLMQAAAGTLVCKGGAEGYQAIGLMPGVLYPNAPAIGIAFKIADGDARGRVRSAVALELLRQLGVLTREALQSLAVFGPAFPLYNWRNILVGGGQPIFELNNGS